MQPERSGHLAAAADGPAADRTGYQLARAQVAVALGKPDEADGIFKQILLEHPLTPEAEIARTRLMAEGAEASLTIDRIAKPGRRLLQGPPLRGSQ